ncbi:serine peptidase, family S28, putative [Talaromyces stipitatus ATCC 10500]|uniref:Serine peptidase, family S28, putative n=1 Tax=Talaromyces stipitatus (strain ATCC 10500 / CBS 375.48 / QM 6759 / NRRL 1006) TaxID=441959 RepID=B8MNZ1_TALSN|nr:serine peptidase, family S28, putative [Talaromyces stipitatus ATCC 10500]EED14230.1 serine peptidase, family S28, putative [Talaromyces stipitatus ATCC 10500]
MKLSLSKVLLSYSLLFVQHVHSIGFVNTPTTRDLYLAAALGLSADSVILNPVAFRKMVDTSYSRTIPTEYADIPIDHDNHTVGTYRNRYWVTTKYYRSGGPVFLYDVGESSAYSSAQHMLGESSFLREFLQEFGGVGIVWEHRYYGESLPMGLVNENTPAENFKFLTHEQAIADIPYFAQDFHRPELPFQDLSPKGTPWIMMGGSYSGMRTAFTRNEYPDTIYAAYASSAPVQARADMSIYFEQVYRGMVANGYEGCARDLHAALSYVDSQLALNGTASDDIKKLFLGEGGEVNSNGDFTAGLAYIYSTFQSYGMGGGDTGLGSLCDWMEAVPTGTGASPTATSTATATNRDENKPVSRIIVRRIQNSPEELIDEPSPATATPWTGWAPFIGNRAVAERFASWPQLLPLINSYAATECSMKAGSHYCNLGGRLTDPASISWTWQYCSEWGFFQADNISPDPTHGLLSTYQSLAYNQEICYRQFPRALEKGVLPAVPATEKTNAKTGGWLIRPSNTYWSGGEFDPWQTLSPLSTENFAPDFVTFRSNIPQCNRKTAEREIFGYVMQNAMHCFDLNMRFQGGEASRDLFKSALKEWLPCWQGKARRAWAA